MALTFVTLPATASKVGVSAVTTFNGFTDGGGASVELVKVGWGVDGTYTDTNATTPLPTGLGTALTSAVVVMQNAVAATANGTNLIVTGYGVSVLLVTGTFVANISFETSVDAGTTWIPISATQIGAGDIVTVATVPGIYRITAAGMDLIRARVTWTSGTVTVNGRSSNAINANKIVKLGTGNLTVGAVNIATPTPATLSSAATTNATLVKATAGTLYSVTASNVGAAAAFLKVFNLTTAPTVGTSVPLLTIPIAASGIANITFGAQGMRLTAGISFSITNLVTDADVTAIAAAQVKVAISYI